MYMEVLQVKDHMVQPWFSKPPCHLLQFLIYYMMVELLRIPPQVCILHFCGPVYFPRQLQTAASRWNNSMELHLVRPAHRDLPVDACSIFSPIKLR